MQKNEHLRKFRETRQMCAAFLCLSRACNGPRCWRKLRRPWAGWTTSMRRMPVRYRPLRNTVKYHVTKCTEKRYIGARDRLGVTRSIEDFKHVACFWPSRVLVQ